VQNQGLHGKKSKLFVGCYLLRFSLSFFLSFIASPTDDVQKSLTIYYMVVTRLLEKQQAGTIY
jgi:hypothetical protein